MFTEYGSEGDEVFITTTVTRMEIRNEFKQYGVEKVPMELVEEVLDVYCMDKDIDGLLSEKPLASLGQVIKEVAEYYKKEISDDKIQ